MPLDPQLTKEMAAHLAVEIKLLTAEYQSRLEDLHDDAIHTRMLWVELLVAVKRKKRQLRVHNAKTNSVLSGLELANTARNSINRLRARAFKDMIAHFEQFLSKFLHLWLSSNPSRLGQKALNIETLLACKTLEEAKSAAIAEAVESTITDRIYKKPETWFNFLAELLEAKFAATDRAAFVEMKARRDVLEHGGGIATVLYVEKAQSAARYAPNDRVQISAIDIDDAFDVVQQLISQVAGAATDLLATRDKSI